jgi:hypothetical protein
LRSNLLIQMQRLASETGKSSRLKLQIQRFIFPRQVVESQLENRGQSP